MVGAQYMLYGNLSSIAKTGGSDKDVCYKMTMRLMDLKTGLIEWADETEIRKQSRKASWGCNSIGVINGNNGLAGSLSA